MGSEGDPTKVSVFNGGGTRGSHRDDIPDDDNDDATRDGPGEMVEAAVEAPTSLVNRG